MLICFALHEKGAHLSLGLCARGSPSRNLLLGICAAVVGEKNLIIGPAGARGHLPWHWPHVQLQPLEEAARQEWIVLKMAFSSTIEVKLVLSTRLTLWRL